MKRIISIFAVICMLTASFASFAFADGEGVKITSATYVSDKDMFTITVNGNSRAGEYVSIVIKNQNGIIRGMEQCRTLADGTFSKDVVVNTSEDKLLVEEGDPIIETIYVRNYSDSSHSYVVPLYSEENKNIIAGKFNNDSVEVMMGLIDKYNSVFGFDMMYYTPIAEEAAKFMIAAGNLEKFTSDNINGKFDEAVIRAYLFNEDYSAGRTEIIEYPNYSSVHGFTEGFGKAASLYPDYRDMSAVEKTAVNRIAFNAENKYKDFAELKEMFFMTVTAEVFAENKDNYAEIYSFLKKHNDWFELKDFETLSTYSASRIIGVLASETIPAKKDEFVSLYNEKLNDNSSDTKPSQPATGGIGGGGGGGGVIGSIPTETTFDPPSAQTPSTPAQQSIVFDDMDGFGWAKPAVEALAKMGVVNGKGNGKFAPGDAVTREEFAKILVMAYGLYDDEATCMFSDVDSQRWSYKYIASIYKCGAVNGYTDGSFGADSQITREEMAVMIYRVMNAANMLLDGGTGVTLNDADKVSDYAKSAVKALAANGIISGDSEQNFNPTHSATRAEACRMIYNAAVDKGGNK